jgi:hypothetical protein
MRILHFLFLLRAFFWHPYLIMAASNEIGIPIPRSAAPSSAGLNEPSNHYVVYPTDSDNKDETEATEDFLRSLTDCDDILANAHAGNILSWIISTQDDYVVSKIQNNSGVKSIQLVAPGRHNVPEPAARERHDQPAYQLYVATAIDPNNPT